MCAPVPVLSGQYASHVYVLVRRDVLRASKVMSKRLLAHPKVTVLWNTVPTEAKGDGDLLQAIEIKDTKTGETKDLPVNGLFYAIGELSWRACETGVPALISEPFLPRRSRARYFARTRTG